MTDNDSTSDPRIASLEARQAERLQSDLGTAQVDALRALADTLELAGQLPLETVQQTREFLRIVDYSFEREEWRLGELDLIRTRLQKLRRLRAQLAEYRSESDGDGGGPPGGS